jgi:hypothetical protein
LPSDLATPFDLAQDLLLSDNKASSCPPPQPQKCHR